MKAMERHLSVMLLHIAALLLLAAPCALIGADSARTSEELFAIAKTYYGSEPRSLPAGTPSGLQCLMKAAEANYPPALYNLFIGHRFGYFGLVDLQKAAIYRARWLEIYGSPAAYAELGLGNLGVWPPMTDPASGKENARADFIFTGSFARENRERVHVQQRAWFGQNKPPSYPVDLARSAYWFVRAVESGERHSSTLEKEDRDAVQKSLGFLVRLTLGEPFELPFSPDGERSAMKKSFVPGEVIPPPETVRVILDAEAHGFELPADSLRAAARLLKRMDAEGLGRIFGNTQTSTRSSAP